MKKLIYNVAIILLVTLTVSCKKETPKPSINGYWTGNVIATGSSTMQFVGLLYKDGGIVRIYAASPDTTLAIKADGTYTIDADSIRSSFTVGSDVTQFSGKLVSASLVNGTLRKTTGSWTGTYSVTKP